MAGVHAIWNPIIADTCAPADPNAPMAFSAGGEYCVPPTETPTPPPVFTSLEMREGGKDEALLGVVFWATFYETQEDRQNSGPIAAPTVAPSAVPLILHDLALGQFLVQSPLCVEGANFPSNNAEVDAIIEPNPMDPMDAYWMYIQHCYDHRFMYGRTLLNGFLNYERRGAIPLRYTEPNLRSFNETNNEIWNYPECRNQAGYVSREAARQADLLRSFQDRRDNGSIEALWLFGYMQCMGRSNDPGVIDSAVGQRIQNAYNYTIWPQVRDQVLRSFYSDFQPYVTTGDPTFGAYSNLDANEDGSSYVVCVGGCVISGISGTERTEEGGFLLTRGEKIVQFVLDVVSLPPNEQLALVREGYDTYLDYLLARNYRSDYASIIQPVLTLQLAPHTNQVVGYTWTSRVYMRAQDMTHFPRVTP